MLTKVETANEIESSGNGKFLNEIESTSEGNYSDLDRNQSMNSRRIHVVDKKSKLQTVSGETPRKAKNKKSLLSWKSLKALSHIGNQRFKCRFFLQVHSIEGLPSEFDGTSLMVNWKNRDDILITQPANVLQGMAEFEEQLSLTCSVYGSKNVIGSRRSAKYEAKHFWLHASSCEAPELDLGKHQIDITRLLPLNMEELEEENSTGNWATSFKLSGKAKGAMINVSFRYIVIGDNHLSPDNYPSIHGSFFSKYDSRSLGKSDAKVGEGDELYIMRRAESLPSQTNQPTLSPSWSLEDIKDLHEILPTSQLDRADSMDVKYQKFDEDEKKKIDICDELTLISPSLFDIEKERAENGRGFESLVVEKEPEKSEQLAFVQFEDKGVKLADCQQNCKNSCSLDNDIEGSEFLDVLEKRPLKTSSDSEPESPRECLLRQFEKEALADGRCSIFDFNTADMEEKESNDEEWYQCISASSDGGNSSPDFELSTLIEAMEEHEKTSKAEKNKTKAKELEDLEAKALMREWGLNEKAFQHSQSISGGFGSPIDLPLGEPLEMRLPPLGEGLGAFLETKNGDSLRSMNPLLFQNAKNGGSLITQVSRPVVVPAKMGSEIMEILQCLASVGTHKLSMQANKLMPLEDITGKTMQQLAWEAASDLEKSERQCSLPCESTLNSEKAVKRRSFATSSKSFCPNPLAKEMDTECVDLQDLAPLAMDKIEALSMEGLRIQSGLSDDDAPLHVNAKPISKGVRSNGSLELEGPAGFHLLDIHNSHNDVEGLIGLSLTLNEWIKLDSGELEEEDCKSDHTNKVLAAHHANSSAFVNGGKKGERKWRRGSKRYGLMGNTFTVALAVQLRDPLRNYEPVGARMLALVQAERVFLQPNPRFHGSVSEPTKDEEGEEKNMEDEDKALQFCIRNVHVAGMKTESSKVWGSSAHRKSGSRWLIANGMGKRHKHPFFISMAASKSAADKAAKGQAGDSLWSISSSDKGKGHMSKEMAAANRYVRNPNVCFPAKIVRARSMF